MGSESKQSRVDASTAMSWKQICAFFVVDVVAQFDTGTGYMYNDMIDTVTRLSAMQFAQANLSKQNEIIIFVCCDAYGDRACTKCG